MKKAVYIEWADALTWQESSWMYSDDLEEWASKNDFIVKEVDFIVKETKKYIVIAGRIGDNGNSMGGIIKIPKPWIIKRKVLKI